ncbi:synaptobrevin-domain-containing protein [Dioszegia hungarica]|uniref:Synaptobrevin homolog YKT6 n=1 Tax=Dioszegia hungarica TaxID=4972 RepID=A0AA38HHE3_9TREE|nr:synaptobrevin-domain-containing protein [Dioszegia hungarica]KAI9639499.1 synaptobrevin-domain-containing protein [Dioszegia hungarica]
MSLIHTLVARGTTVLAEYAGRGAAELKPGTSRCQQALQCFRSACRTSNGEHEVITECCSHWRSVLTAAAAQIAILGKIPPNDSKLTYVWQDRLIHYVSSAGVIYLVMADDSVGRRMPFAFLAEVERRFTNMFSPDEIVSASSHSLGDFEAELSKLMHQYTTAPPADPLKQARSDLDNVKDIMVQNIDSILQRGERLDLLVDKTDTLAGQAYAFRRGARNVRRQQWWRNTRIMVLTGVVGVIILYLFIAQFCGLSLSSCRS